MAQENVNKNDLTDFIDVESLNFFRNAERVTRRKLQKQTIDKAIFQFEKFDRKDVFQFFYKLKTLFTITIYILELTSLLWCKEHAKMILRLF